MISIVIKIINIETIICFIKDGFLIVQDLKTNFKDIASHEILPSMHPHDTFIVTKFRVINGLILTGLSSGLLK